VGIKRWALRQQFVHISGRFCDEACVIMPFRRKVKVTPAPGQPMCPPPRRLNSVTHIRNRTGTSFMFVGIGDGDVGYRWNGSCRLVDGQCIIGRWRCQIELSRLVRHDHCELDWWGLDRAVARRAVYYNCVDRRRTLRYSVTAKRSSVMHCILGAWNSNVATAMTYEVLRM
jgi:hypothetical protein